MPKTPILPLIALSIILCPLAAKAQQFPATTVPSLGYCQIAGVSTAQNMVTACQSQVPLAANAKWVVGISESQAFRWRDDPNAGSGISSSSGMPAAANSYFYFNGVPGNTYVISQTGTATTFDFMFYPSPPNTQ